LASYALLGSLSGFRYSAVDKALYLKPKLSARPFKTFFSTAGGFGTISLADMLTIEVIEGKLEVELIFLPGQGMSYSGVATPGSPIEIPIV
jgi:hypothetical protein